jgi:hypothetical protein
VVDKDKVWRDWNKKLSKFGRGTAAGVAAGAIVQGIVDGVGWIIDEGGKVTKKPTAETLLCSANLQSCYEMAGGLRRGSPESVCSAFNKKNGTVYHSATANTCYYSANGTKAVLAPIYKINNPSYNSSAPPPENTVVSEEEKEQVLKNLLNDPKYADLAAQMIGNTYSMGPDNPEPDPNVVNDLKDKQKDVLKSDNPKGDGKTRTDPKIDTGTQGQADTTPKPDTGTGTNPDTGTGTTPSPNPSTNNGSTTNFELPAFCNYAAKLCDWLDWTQEDKELEEAEKEEPEELDLGTIDKNRFRANGQCPAPIQVNESVRSLGKSVDFDLTIEWTQICNVAEDTSPLVLLISTITGLLILVGGGRSGES